MGRQGCRWRKVLGSKGIGGFGAVLCVGCGPSVTPMAIRTSKTKAGLKAARDAVAATQREVVARAQRNGEDLAVFFSAQERLAGVEDWLAGRMTVLKEQAGQRQLRERAVAGDALKAMRDRGESVREIGRLAGIGEKTVRELIRIADTTPADTRSTADSGPKDEKSSLRTRSAPVRDAAPTGSDADAAFAVGG